MGPSSEIMRISWDNFMGLPSGNLKLLWKINEHHLFYSIFLYIYIWVNHPTNGPWLPDGYPIRMTFRSFYANIMGIEQ